MPGRFPISAVAAAIIWLQLVTLPLLQAGDAMPAAKANDKCPVCGMFVSSHRNWISSVRLKNGSVLFFDGPKDMFSYYLSPGKYVPSAKQSSIAGITVKDYYSLKPVDALKACFVAGSNVFGPMGKELVPLARESDAQAFMKDHKGKTIYRFNEITPAILRSLE